MTWVFVIILIILVVFLSYVVKLMLAPPDDAKNGEEAENFPIEEMLNASGRGPVGNGGGSEREVQEAGEQILKRLDQRINLLKGLIEKADQRIDALQNPGYVLPAEYPDSENPAMSKLRRPGPAPTSRGRRKRAAAGPVKSGEMIDDDRRTKIISLHRRGIPVQAIAREVNMGKGEIELILKIEGYGA